MKGLNFLLNIPTKKIKMGLTRTKKLLKACGSPEKNIYSIQISGTNGKGSTTAFLTNILIKSNYKVGLYTSPHLVMLNERIQINFKNISNNNINQFVLKYKKDINNIKPSFFEIMTVLALWFFVKQKVNIAILETGLGGRLDSVTACKNQVIGITNIDLDHQEILGQTIEEITKEKIKAILNSKQLVFSIKQNSKTQKAIKERTKDRKCYLKIVQTNKKLKPKFLLGKHQIRNASLAEAIARKIKKQFAKITEKTIKKAICETKWPGRFQTIYCYPHIIYDVAHNSSGINSFIVTFKNFIKNKNFNNKHLICAFEHNKNIKKELKKLDCLFDTITCTETQIRKSMPCKELSKIFNQNKTTHTQNIKKVLLNLRNKEYKKDLICIIGSHFFAPHIKLTINKKFANQ